MGIGADHRTGMFDDASELGAKRSVPGMAHWAGSGPLGKECRHCLRFAKTVGNNGRCGKYRELAGRRGPVFSRLASACKYFEER